LFKKKLPPTELELELIQAQMALKPMLRARVYALAFSASQNVKRELRSHRTAVLRGFLRCCALCLGVLAMASDLHATGSAAFKPAVVFEGLI
jgi:hypothetical protein